MVESVVTTLVSILLLLVLLPGPSLGGQQPPRPVRNLQITLGGERYDIEDDVTTVRELQERMKGKMMEIGSDESILSSPQSVLFDGKRLGDDDILSEAGVQDGAQLNMVPAAASCSSSSSSTKTKAKKKSSPSSSSSTTISAQGDKSSDSSSSIETAMQEYLKKAGVDTNQLEELVKSLGEGGGGNGGAGGGMPSMKESLEMMNSMMNSDLFQSYMNDPDKLEQSRQMILNNPMLKSMMSGMPGMEQILNDPVAWREAMQAAASMYKNMDPDTLMSMMSMGGAGAGAGMAGDGSSIGGGLPPGLFSGTLDDPSSTAAAAALDELDEDE
jgi:hypothetical protein